MQPQARIINCARGSVVDHDAVVEAVRDGRLGGAAFDVYTQEPPESYEFAQNDNILATPHLGASTEEAQIAVATEAAEQMVDALLYQQYRNALNVTPVPPEEMKVLQPYCDLAASLGKIVAQLNDGRPESVAISCKGDVAEHSMQPIVNYGLMGVLRHMVGDVANIVSAPHLAEERGIRVTSSSTVGREAGFTDLIEIKLTTERREMAVAGTVFGHSLPRVVSIGEFYVEVIPEGDLLVVRGRDVPGLIGRVGAILGEAGVNVARMGFGRREKGGEALLALNLDSRADEPTLEDIRALDVVVELGQASL
jgi:D-3-phosphoglycerate dehydrogenase